MSEALMGVGRSVASDGDSTARKRSRAVWRPKPPESSGAGMKVNVSSGEIASRRAERRPTLSAERYLYIKL